MLSIVIPWSFSQDTLFEAMLPSETKLKRNVECSLSSKERTELFLMHEFPRWKRRRRRRAHDHSQWLHALNSLRYSMRRYVTNFNNATRVSQLASCYEGRVPLPCGPLISCSKFAGWLCFLTTLWEWKTCGHREHRGNVSVSVVV